LLLESKQSRSFAQIDAAHARKRLLDSLRSAAEWDHRGALTELERLRERTASPLLQPTRFARPLSLSLKLHADAQTGKGYTRTTAVQKAVHCCLWRWSSERELGRCSLRSNRLARIFGKFLASGFFDEGTASERSENHRINTRDLWWAWVDLNHRPRPYQGNVVRFYNNIQDRGDCQTPRKSYKTARSVG
jgi:hypothetical protein